jgi:hypothetical protein
MKAIIEGKRFDTDKANLIGRYSTPGIGTSNFRYFEADLYKTPRSGIYFLAGQGHAMTPFCRQSADGMRGWGEKIIPMSREEALEWAEQFLSVDEIEAGFSEIQDA